MRGLPVLLHERSAARHCPRRLPRDSGEASPVTLATVFLLDPARARGGVDGDPGSAPRARYSPTLRLFHLVEKHGRFLWDNHLERVAD
ncbi:hypothetical protein ABZT45_41300 [Streptomyces sp. NPDC005356]|uniref:hypothetical protein n=1 Tax=unclassified Streptomyces TaxID=2593676 RepID=UPI0033A3AF1E